MPCGRCRAVASEREPARSASARLVDRAFELLRWGFRAGALGLRGCHVDRPAFGNPLPERGVNNANTASRLRPASERSDD